MCDNDYAEWQERKLTAQLKEPLTMSDKPSDRAIAQAFRRACGEFARLASEKESRGALWLHGALVLIEAKAKEIDAAEPAGESAERGEIVITTNETGTECYVVSRQDSEGRILQTLWEAPVRSDEPSAAHWKKACNEMFDEDVVVVIELRARELEIRQ